MAFRATTLILDVGYFLHRRTFIRSIVAIGAGLLGRKGNVVFLRFCMCNPLVARNAAHRIVTRNDGQNLVFPIFAGAMTLHAAVPDRGMFVVGHDHADRFQLLRERRFGYDIELVNSVVAAGAGPGGRAAGRMGVFVRKGNRVEDLVPERPEVAFGAVHVAIGARDLFPGVRRAPVNRGERRIGMTIKTRFAAERSRDHAQGEDPCSVDF